MGVCVARIDRFVSRTQAELAAGFLGAHGIHARVFADDAGGLRPDIAFGIGGTVLVVDDDELDEALALLDDASRTPPAGDDGTPP